MFQGNSLLQSEVRRVYRDLLDSDDHSFTGFNLENGYVRFSLVFCMLHIFPSIYNVGLCSTALTTVRLFQEW